MQRKSPCRTYSTANLDLGSTGATAVVNGVTLASGDRLLVVAQSSAAENGIYEVGASSCSRAADADSAADWDASWYCQAADMLHRWTHPGSYTLGTTAVTISQVVISTIDVDPATAPSARRQYIDRYVLPTPNYTSWGRTRFRPSQDKDTFGGPGVWDPVAGVWRAYWHDVNANTIVMQISNDGVQWGQRQVVLEADDATPGDWWDGAVGVPFVMRIDGWDRPWVMFARAHAGTPATLYIGVWTSTDGITWANVDPNGSAYTAPVIGSGQAGQSIDHGNVFWAEGYFWLYWNVLADRKQYVSRSKDLITWEHWTTSGTWASGSVSVAAVIEGYADAGGEWDYSDAEHQGYAAEAGYGYFCGWYGYWPREDGTPEYRAYLMSYRGDNSLAGITCWTSDSPFFGVANRRFRGWVTIPDEAGMELYGREVDSSGFDVPRLVSPDWRQRGGPDSRLLYYSYCLEPDTWAEELLVRPAGLPVATKADDYTGAVLSGVDGLLPLGAPSLQLAPAGDSNTLLHYWPSRHGLVDLSGNGLHLYPMGQDTQFDSSGFKSGRSNGGMATHAHGTTPAPFASAITALTLEFYATKTAVLGAGAGALPLQIGGSAKQCTLRLNGSSGDTACTWLFVITDSGGTQRSCTSDAFDWATASRKHICVTWDGTNARFYHDGVLISTKALAYTGGNLDDTSWTIWLSGKQAFSYWWPGYLDAIRVSSSVRYTAAFTPAPPALTRQTSGYIYSGVYDFERAVVPQLDLRSTVPAGCDIQVRYRAASGATDRSTSWAEFGTSSPPSRYQQFALLLSGDGVATPIINNIRLLGLL